MIIRLYLHISVFLYLVIGMTQAMNGRFRTAVTCRLALSGLCDMFDGKIARR